jgi:hypothetical protein
MHALQNRLNLHPIQKKTKRLGNMKKSLIFKVAMMCMFLFATSQNAGAQNLKSILSSVAKAVVGDNATTATSIVGTWKYSQPECAFESDNLLTQAGGEAAATKVEKKLATIYKTLKLTSTTYTFNSDNTCSYTVGSKTVSGTYTFDSTNKTVTITSSTLGTSFTAYVVTTGSTMTLTFDADKLLTVMQTISSSAASVNSTASLINTLAGSYSGMRLGFELTKK